MRRLAAALAAVLAVLVAGPAGAADDGLRIVSVDSSGYPGVRIVVEVPDRVVGEALERGAWTLTERGVERAATVRSVVNDSLRVILVVDTSGSMQGASMAAAKTAAKTFLDRLPPGSEVGVVGFGSQPAIVHAVSADKVGAAAAIDALHAVGETALYDAVIVAAQQAPADGRATEMVVLSDGGDTVSAASLEAAARVLEDSRARLHAIALDTAESNRTALDALSARGGGNVVAASDATALGSVYDRLAERLVHRYELTYESIGNGQTPVVVTGPASTGWVRGETTVDLPAARFAPSPPHRPLPSTPATMLLIGGALVFIGLAVLLAILFLPAAPRALLAGAAKHLPHRGRLADLSDRATLVAQAALDSGKAKGIAVALENAGIMLRPAEFVVTVVSVALGAALLGFVFGGPLLGLLFPAMVLFGSRLFVTNRIEKRRKHFSNQLSDTLQQLTSALRAGHGLMQALAVVAREAEEPTSDEFRRLMTEIRLGRDLADALHAMAGRVSSEDFDWVVQAVEVQRDVGGDLVEVIDIVANTIRQRQHLQRQVKALSAEGRFSAYVLLALPFGVAGLLFLTNRAYLMQLFVGRGLVLLGASVVLMVAGTAWLKKIIQLEY